MKQGTTRKLKPKPKREKKSWQTRNAARLHKQETYKAQEAANGNVTTEG